MEDGFREVETSVLAEVSSYKKCVVATGGGIIKRRENWMHLRNGVVLCLSGPASLLAKRVVVGVPAACPRGKGGGRGERWVWAGWIYLQNINETLLSEDGHGKLLRHHQLRRRDSERNARWKMEEEEEKERGLTSGCFFGDICGEYVSFDVGDVLF